VTHHWPDFATEAGRFYGDHMKRPRKLFEAFTARGKGSGRRPGPRTLYWQTVVMSSLAALESGLEDVVYAAHGARQSAGGQVITKGANAVDSNPRKWLVEDRLMAPDARKIERLIFADFGLLLDDLPPSARFKARNKEWSKGGSGRGVEITGPTTWRELADYLDTMHYIRNATAHGDAAKLGACPKKANGVLWLQKEDGDWSVQQPHALTSLRTTVSAFNAVAEGLAAKLGLTGPTLTKPDTIDYPT
jgi:hypothetical protein